MDGKAWNEAAWNWEDSILKLRELISKRADNIFRKQKEPKDKGDDVRTLVFNISFLTHYNGNISITEKL